MQYNQVNWAAPYPYAQGGPVKGYAQGGLRGPGGEFEVEEDVTTAVIESGDIDDATDLEILEGMAIDNSQPSSRSDELITMLQRDTGQYNEQLSQQRGQYNAATTDFTNMINKMADGQSKGPSESEKWFRLAAAFGQPTQSGSFFDSLGNASKALGDIASERRQAESSGDALKMQGAQFSLGLLKEQMENTSGLAAEERSNNKDMQTMLLDWEKDSRELLQQRQYDLALIKGERNIVHILKSIMKKNNN